MGNAPAPGVAGIPNPPAAPAAAPAAAAPADLKQTIVDLENQSKNQDLRDAKLQLAALKQISAEVDQAEAGYKKELGTMTWQYSHYGNPGADQIDKAVPAAEKAIIDGIVAKVGAQIEAQKEQWKAAQPVVGVKQAAWATAQIARQEKEKPYRDALAYKATLNDLDALQAQSTKLIDAKNFRGAYFLVEVEMAADLKVQLPAEADYNTNLEKLAIDFFTALDAERMAKTDFDQATADLQKKQKAYTDANSSRRTTILQLIADQQFAPAAPGPPPAAAPAGGPAPAAAPAAAPGAVGGAPAVGYGGRPI